MMMTICPTSVGEHLPAIQRQALRRFDLAVGGRVDAGAGDLADVGAEVDHVGQDRRRQGGHLQAQAGQAEEDEEQLNDERRVADQLHVQPHAPARPARALAANQAAGDAQHGAEHRRDQSQRDRQQHAVQQQRPLFEDHRKIQRHEGIVSVRLR
jgi:hypothetical protein